MSLVIKIADDSDIVMIDFIKYKMDKSISLS